MISLTEKNAKLREFFKQTGSAVIAFSGGVDSTFMLASGAPVLQKHNLFAVTAVSSFFPQTEKTEAEAFCCRLGIRHIFLPVDILKVEGVAQNPQNRCYLCKYALFTQIKRCAYEYGIDCVCEGSNMDDLGDYRPGLQAVAELGIKSPLREAALTKQDIRDLSKNMQLPTWNKPSFACLASRFVYGEKITAEKLSMVEKAEHFLQSQGFQQFRVRLHGTMARIEILPQDFDKMTEATMREKIYTEFTNYGFSYTTLDLRGYRTGSMNETVLKDNK